MMEKFASLEGTKSFASRHSASENFFSSNDSFYISSISQGGFSPEPYREENYLFSFKDAFVKSVELGGNYFDSSLFFRYTKSSLELGEALGEIFARGLAVREEVVLGAKAGFIPFCYPMPKNPYSWIEDELVKKGICEPSDILSDQYALNPEFLEFTLLKSLETLGVKGIDIFYIQNPEFLKGEVGGDEFEKRVRRAFEACEEFVSKGIIKSCGITTWNGFFYEPEHPEYLSLQKIVSIAKSIAGDKHSFKYIQFPYGLGKVHAATLKTQDVGGKKTTLFEAGAELGVDMITLSPFLRMNIFKKPFSPSFRALCGGEAMSDIQRALLFASSNGFALSSVFGAIEPAHVEHNFEIKNIDKIPSKNYAKIFGL